MWASSSSGFLLPSPLKRSTRFPFFGKGSKIWMSPGAKPASTSRFSMARAATVLSPTEWVVLISISSL
ncbi:hypothetical protein D3C72_2131500 [compost metagenome]